jgi:predicted permease
MNWHRSWAARTRGLLRRGKREREMNEEVGFHLEMQAREFERRGMSAKEALQAARRRFGGVEQVKEEYRRQGSVPWLESFGKDLGFGLRMLRKSPLVTAVALVSLALGLGASGAIFNVLDSLLFAKLPVPHPDQLVVLKIRRPEEPQPRVFYPAFRMWQGDSGVFSGVIAFSRSSSMLVRSLGAASTPRPASTGDELGEWVDGVLVSGSYFPVLGVHALLGRTLTADDDRVAGGHPVAMISYAYWQRRFAGDPAVLGRTLEVNGQLFAVVGVTPPGFFGAEVGEAPALFVPTAMQTQVHYVGNSDIEDGADATKPWTEQPHIGWLVAMARLRPGVSARQAAAAATVTYHQFAAANVDPKHPENLKKVPAVRIQVEPGAQGVSRLRDRDVALPLVILMGAAVLLLLIACANTANLLLARASARRKEIAVRLSQGAGRARLVRQLLTESLLLAVIAGACGLLLARWGSGLLLRIASGRATGWPIDLSLGWHKLAFLTVACLATALLFGLAPALQATRLDLVSALKVAAGSTHGGGPRTRLPLGKLLVIAEVGLSLVLLVGAGLFVRTLQNLGGVDPGFRRSDLLLVRIHTQLMRLDPPRLHEMERRIQERMSALPGVRSASLSLHSPVSGSQHASGVEVPGYTARPGEDMSVSEISVTPGYFKTLGIPFREGRDFASRDSAEAPHVTIVNEAMARKYFRGRDAVGQRFGYDTEKPREFEIVGVVRDARFYDLREAAPPMMFMPAAQSGESLRDVELRTARGMAASLVPQARQALREVEPTLAIGSVGTMEQQLERSLTQDRAVARLTTFFGAVALLLASIGLYGVISYGVARRRSEIGLRLALGAARGQVLGLVLRETLQLATVGVALGLLGALAATRLAASQLYGLTATDPLTVGAAIVVMAAVASLAGYMPARRAAEVDPLTALRSD